MKTRITRHVLFLSSILLALVITGCFEITVINQPAAAVGGGNVVTTLTVKVEGNIDINSHYGIVGLLVPNDWTIDSVYFSGGYTDYCTYLHPDSADNETGGQVDFWADELETRYPSGDGMMWMVYQSSSAHAVLNETLDVALTVEMIAGVTEGTFNIGYFVTDAALDFSDTTYYDISLNNPITVSNIVPVELSSFTASASKNGVSLNWITASEKNNLGFEIQRSSDNKNYSAVAFVEGRGTTTSRSSYSYVDKNISDGVNTYRLKQVDYDGTFSYSKSVEVDLSVPSEYVVEQNYPNPFNPTTSIRFGLPIDSKVVVTIYNSVGEAVQVLTNRDFTAGQHILNINASDLSSGTYIYTLSAEGSDGSKFIQSNKMILMK